MYPWWQISWSERKNAILKRRRGVSFEEILRGRLIAAMEHPVRKNQNVLLFEVQDYVWVVPYVKGPEGIFLKTLFPSRKYTKLWQEGRLP